MLRLLLAFSRPGGRLTITAALLRKVDIPLAVAVTEMNPNSTEIESHLEVFEGIQRLAEISGAPLGEVHIHDVETVADEIIFVTRNLVARQDAPSVAFQIQSSLEVSASQIGKSFVDTNHFAIGKTRIAYSAIVVVESVETAACIQWRSTSIKIHAVSIINELPADYDKFVARERSLSSTPNALIGRTAKSLD